MMAISASGIGMTDVQVNTKSKSKNQDETATDAFSTLMNMTVSQRDDNVVVEDTSQDNNVVVEDTSQDNKVFDETIRDDVEEFYKSDCEDRRVTEVAESDVQQDNTVKETVSETQNADNNYNELEEDAVVEDAIKALKEIIAQLKEALGLTDEQFTEVLDNMNIEVHDLLDVSVVKSFVLQVSNSSEVNMLINEELAGMVNDIIESVQAILEVNNIDDVQFAQNILASREITGVDDLDEAISDIVATLESTENVLVDNDFADDTNDSAKVMQVKEVTDEISARFEKANVSVDDVSDTSGQLGDNYNPQQFGDSFQDTDNSVIANLNQAINKVVAVDSVDTTISSFTDSVQEMDIIRQIIDDIKVTATKEISSMEIQLNPEHLGKVQINVASKNGIMQAQIVAETEAAKNAIENNMVVLRETLNNQDLKVEAIEVMVGTYEFFNQAGNEKYEEQNKKSLSKGLGNINLNEDIVEDDVTPEEQLEIELMRAKGNSVSYTV